MVSVSEVSSSQSPQPCDESQRRHGAHDTLIGARHSEGSHPTLRAPRAVERLVELGVIEPESLCKAWRSLGRSLGELLAYDAAWLEALRAHGSLTPWQAKVAAAGKVELLRAGPYVLCRPMRHLGYASYYVGRRANSEQRLVLVADLDAAVSIDQEALACLLEKSARLDALGLLPVCEADVSGGRFWAAARLVPHVSLAEFLAQHGRMPAEVVLHAARAMTCALAACERWRLLHGDIRAEQVLLCQDGELLLAMPGVRGLLRPVESLSQAEAVIEVLQGVAPERLLHAVPATAMSDLYSCGALWWQMLVGRPPKPGTIGAAQLAACDRRPTYQIRSLVPNVPEVLEEVIEACLHAQPSARPPDFSHVASCLGAPTAAGRAALAKCLRSQRGLARWLTDRTGPGSKRKLIAQAAAAAAVFCAVALTAIWPNLVRRIHDSQQRGSAKAAAASRPRLADTRRSKGSSALEPKVRDTYAARRQRAASLRAMESRTQGGRRWDSEHTSRTLLLPQNRLNHLAPEELKPGTVVRPAGEGRAVVVASEGGTQVAVEGVQFVQIDFVSADGAESNVSASAPSQLTRLGTDTPLLRISAWSASFEDCTFQQTSSQAAVVWEPDNGGLGSMNTGAISFSRCIWNTVGPAVRCRHNESIVLQMADILVAGRAALVELAGWPRRDALVAIVLRRATVRGVQAVIACPGSEEPAPGRLAIETNQCALDVSGDGALLLFTSAPPHISCLGRLSWRGEGGVVGGTAPVLAWQRRSGEAQPLREDRTDIKGLVRGELHFAGPPHELPHGSEVVEFRAPLRSFEPPGARIALLPKGPHH